jgi:poly-gamma-glutamate synthesis protein (capsule biosynthesis protein)
MKLRKHKARVWMWAGLGVVLLAVLAGAYYLAIPKPERVDTSSTQQTEKAEPKPVSLTANTLFLGDVYWGRYINDWSMKSQLKTAYPFSRLDEFDRDSYDAWIANLECPTVAGFTQTSAQEDATLSFNCSPEYLPQAAKWFDIVSLANNHTDNRGAEGFTETKKHLDENKIQYFGHYDPDVLSDVCEVVSLPVTVRYDDKTTKHQKLPIALCGYHGVFKIPSAESIAQIKKYAKRMPVIAMPHMGAEYQTAPDSLRQATYRAMIDAGADMVLGNHPHWIQSTESYKGKLIVYSMGNFIFDQQANKEVTRSAAIRVVMNTTDSSSDQLNAWLKVGETCTAFKDDCLAEVKKESLQELPMEYRFGVVGTNSANKITKPATSAEQQQILQRLNWAQTMKQLQLPQGSL